MSAKLHHRINNLSASDASVFIKNEEKSKLSIFDNINVNNLNNYYNKDESLFKKKVDKLNFRFYLETDKFINFKHEMEKSQDHLFLLLFKQISVYVEEIERLNLKIKEREEYEKFNKYKIDEMKKRDVQEKELGYYKTTVRNLEKRVCESRLNEEKLKKENESFKRQVMFFKEKLKLELSAKKEFFPNNSVNNVLTVFSTPNGTTKKTINSGVKSKNDSNLKLEFKDEDKNGNPNHSQAFNENFNNVEDIKKSNSGSIQEKNEILENGDSKHSLDMENLKNTIKRLDSSTLVTESKISSPMKKRRNISAFDGSSKIINEKKSNVNTGIKPKNLSVSSQKNELRPTTGFGSSFKHKNISKNSNLNSIQVSASTSFKSKNHSVKNPNLTSVNQSLSHRGSDRKTNEGLSKLLNEQEINEFADLFHQNLNDELDLLHNEEEILINLKHNLINDIVGSAHESDSDSFNGINTEAQQTKTPVKIMKKLQIRNLETDDKNFKQLLRGVSGSISSRENRENNSIPISGSLNSCRLNQNICKSSNKSELNKKSNKYK